MEIPSDLKFITPYIQRGQELLQRDPVVAYYGRIDYILIRKLKKQFQYSSILCRKACH